MQFQLSVNPLYTEKARVHRSGYTEKDKVKEKRYKETLKDSKILKGTKKY